MTGPIRLRTIDNGDGIPATAFSGRVMRELAEQDWSPVSSVAYKAIYQMGRQVAIDLVDEAGVRGRAGGGFPTGHKWRLVHDAESEQKYFVCNANSMQPGSLKEGWLIRKNPLKVVESVAIATHCAGAELGYLCLPQSRIHEIALLESAIQSAHEIGLLGKNAFGTGSLLNINLVKTPDSYIAGEESALLNFIEGKPLQPRGKPPLPTSTGLFGKPTAVNNLETVLQCRYALKVGPQTYQQEGTANAPGTMIFTLTGQVNSPGLYELPLGASLRELIFDRGKGVSGDAQFKAVFPGGVGSAILDAGSLDTHLDFDSMRDAGSDLGSGVVIVFGSDVCMVELATDLAGFFSEASCGKCRPCKDGTGRTHTMLTRIDRLHEPGVDIGERKLAPSKRQSPFTIVNNLQRGVSYTDTVKGLDKISHLCEFFKYRGDCHFSNEAATSLISLLASFRDEFDHHMRFGSCSLPVASWAQGPLNQVPITGPVLVATNEHHG